MMPVNTETAERERQHGAVEADGLESRDVARIDGAHDVEARLGDQQTGRAAEEAEHDAFREQLANEPVPAGAERGADRDFLLPSGGAREQQVCDVRARNQQHERHRSEQHEHRPPHVSDDRSSSGTTLIVNVRSRLSLSRMRAAMTLTSDCACSTVTPGLKRAIRL